MYKIQFDGNGKCLGPCLLCAQCNQLIGPSDMETSLLTWRTSIDMTGVKDVPAIFLHADCIKAYAKRHKKPYGEWNGVTLTEVTSSDPTIYTIDPEQLER